MADPVRVAVADECSTSRALVRRMLAGQESVEVVAEAASRRELLAELEDRPVDLVLLDVELPEQGGLEALKALQERAPALPVALLSATSQARRAVEALALGAVEVIRKPNHPSEEDRLVRALERVVRCALAARTAQPVSAAESEPRPVAPEPRSGSLSETPELVVMGVSTGGPRALRTVLSSLSPSFPLPIVVIQHMAEGFTSSLALSLNADCALPVREVQPGDRARAGGVYVAPGGRHLELGPRAGEEGEFTLRIFEGEPENGGRPSIDRFLRSTARRVDRPVLSVLLTGMGTDGAHGVQATKEASTSYCLAQDEASSVVWGIPRSGLELGVVDEVLALDAIGERLEALASGDPA
ncbi:MAG: chemotaxis protein CheB [Myxococcota bacterium]